jgi:pyruvate,water dikinase
MKAIWKGFTHPGISWSGTIAVDTKKLVTLFAVSATSEVGETLGGISYAILSMEYMNLSARFGYHFATVDTLCSENSNQNYISLQFSGGAGNYYGKSLRISFLGSVLKKLGFQISLKGDLIEASLAGYDKAATESMLDLLGRLLASSRLLDMALSGQNDIERLTDAFFREDYDFLSQKREDRLHDFYTHGGDWKRMIKDGHAYCLQDGTKAGFSLSSGVAGVVGKLVGQALQDFLDNMEAYYYFPLAIAKGGEISDGAVSVKVLPVSGHIDRAGGIAFGIQNISNYFVMRINALEDNVILFEYINGKRMQRVAVKEKIASNTWYLLSVETRGSTIKGYLDGRLVVEYIAEKPIKGFVGLWTKADSLTYFDELRIQTDGHEQTIPF